MTTEQQLLQSIQTKVESYKGHFEYNDLCTATTILANHPDMFYETIRTLSNMVKNLPTPTFEMTQLKDVLYSDVNALRELVEGVDGDPTTKPLWGDEPINEDENLNDGEYIKGDEEDLSGSLETTIDAVTVPDLSDEAKEIVFKSALKVADSMLKVPDIFSDVDPEDENLNDGEVIKGDDEDLSGSVKSEPSEENVEHPQSNVEDVDTVEKSIKESATETQEPKKRGRKPKSENNENQ